MEADRGSLGLIVAQLLKRAAQAIERDPSAIDRLLQRADAALCAIEAALPQAEDSSNGPSTSTSRDSITPRERSPECNGTAPHAGSVATDAPATLVAPPKSTLVEPRGASIASLAVSALANAELAMQLRLGDNAPTRAGHAVDLATRPMQQKIHHISSEWHDLLMRARDMELMLLGVRRAARFGRAAGGGDLVSLLTTLQAHDPALHARVDRALVRLGKARVHPWPAYLHHEPPPGLLAATERAYAALRLSMLLLWEDVETIAKSGRALHGVAGPLRTRIERTAELVAETQCMVKTAAAMLHATGGVVPVTLTGNCAVQTRVFEMLREIIDRDNLGLFLRAHMTARDTCAPSDASQLLRRVHKLNEERRRSDGLTAPQVDSEVDDEASDTENSEPHRFVTIVDAVAEAERLFGSGRDAPLVILDSAYDSAAQSPYRRPDDVFRLLTALGETAQTWRNANGAIGRSFAGLLTERGFGEKPISQTAVSRYRSDYTLAYKGQSVLFECHWTLGSGNPNTCLSVHWHRDVEEKRLVIGYCGRHLRNAGT